RCSSRTCASRTSRNGAISARSATRRRATARTRGPFPTRRSLGASSRRTRRSSSSSPMRRSSRRSSSLTFSESSALMASRPEAIEPQQESVGWTIEDSADLYRITSWGEPYFFINEAGHVAVRALDAASTTMDVVDIVNELRRRGIKFPILIRFQDVLRAQVKRINEAFREAIDEAGYENVYRGVYPIKVNQLHEVVDELLDAGKPYGMGLECGSKAELLATLPHADNDTRLVL